MPGLACALACSAAPAGPEPPRSPAAGAGPSLEEKPSSRVLYHEESGGLANTVPPPRSGARPPLPPLPAAGSLRVPGSGPAAAEPGASSPARTSASAPKAARSPAPPATPAVAPPAPDAGSRWAAQVDRAIATSDGRALAELAGAPGAAYECSQPTRALAVAEALAATGNPARAAEILDPLAGGCDAVTRLSVLERARHSIPRDAYLRWEAREAGAPRDPASERRYRGIVYSRILEDRAADGGSASDRAARMASDAGPYVVEFRDAGVALGLGWLWLEAGDPASAGLWFGRAHDWAPDWEDAISGLAQAAMQERDYERALAYADKLPAAAPGRAAIRRDALVGVAQRHYAVERYAEAGQALEQAAREGELPRYARSTQAWCSLRLGDRELAAARFAVLYRESPDSESAQGLLAASGRAIPADLAETQPLRALVAAGKGEEAFRNGRYLEARALDAARWGDAGAPGVPQALLGGGSRKKTGEPGLGRMRQSLWPAAEVAAGLGSRAAVAVRSDRARLDAGTLSPQAIVGTAPAGGSPTPEVATEATVDEARVALRYERDHALTVAVGRGPGGGPVGARITGMAEIAVTPAWGQAALALYAEPVRETVLSYAGMRDPWTGTPWGGVMRRGAEFRALRLREAPYSAGLRLRGEKLDGTLVQDNTRAVLDATAARDLGLAGFAYAAAGVYAGLEGYRRNLGGFTVGHGGYFSPQRYGRVGAALDFMTEEDRRWLVRGRFSGGWFSKRDDASPVLPLEPDGRFYAGGESHGREGAFRLAAVVQASPHVQVGAMAGRSISPAYAENIVRVELRVLFEPRRSVVGADLPAARGE